jgi:tetratricopeptide (TPR) repeat protein
MNIILFILCLLTSSISFSQSDSYKLVNYGMEKKKIKDYDSAIYYFTLAIKQFPETRFLYKLRGGCFLDNNDISKALIDLTKCIEISIGEDCLNMRGVAYNELGNYMKAIDDFNQALKINPDYLMVLESRGFSYLSIGEINLAINDFDQSIKYNPLNYLTYYNRGLAFEKNGSKNLALNDYDSSIILNPNYKSAFINRSLLLLEEKNYEDAINDINSALRIDSTYSISYFNKGLILFQMQRYKEAKQEFTNAIVYDQNMSNAYKNRAIINYFLGYKDESCIDIYQAQSLGLRIEVELLEELSCP